ncbi:putative porin [bacterium]|nr:putative porin [bacterium]MCP5462179.1 putative porin [bacterium]
MVKKTLLAVICIVLCASKVMAGGYPGNVMPNEIQDDSKLQELEKMLKDQAKTIESLQNQVKNLQDEKDSHLHQLPPTASAAAAGEETWADRIKWFGDFRLRHQIIDDDGAAGNTVRNRTRMRVRPGLTAKVNDDIDFIFRLTTGEPANSGNQTFDDYFDSKDIFIDLAYVHYHPEEILGNKVENDIIKELHFFGGKMKNPFYRVGDNEIVFDKDVTPEGGAVKVQFQCPTDTLCMWLSAGGFVVEEDEDDADASLWGVQGGFKSDLGKHENLGEMKLVTGISYYNYGSIKGRALPSGGAWGNTTKRAVPGGVVEEDVFASDFDILEVFGELEINPLDVPVLIYTMYVVNAATDEDHQAWGAGATIGKTKKVGDWETGYFYRRVEADSVLGVFTDSDFVGGGSDGHGHRVHVGYKLAENVKTKATFFLARKIIEDSDDFWNMLFDVEFYW